MEIEKINAKLDAFAGMVLKDATHKAGLLLNQAEIEKQQIVEDKEIAFLKGAYRNIQEAINRIEKENNTLYSAKLFEAKQLLFKKRQEIMDAVFDKVLSRLEEYHGSNEYGKKLKAFIEKGLETVGQGEIHVFVDNRDYALTGEVKDELNQSFIIEESEEPLLGGCLVVNRTSGLMADYSFISRLNQQRAAFLENSGMNVNLETRN